MITIYQFYKPCGRHGTLKGLFVANPEDIRFAIGKTVCFEEPWGKHSEAEVTLDPECFKVSSSLPGDVAVFQRLRLESGHNPLALLHDAIADGRIELTEEESRGAPEYFRSALRSRP